MPRKPNERRRKQLFDGLTDIILTEGFRDLRIGEVADRLHCSRSTLYKLADTKDELVTSVFETYVRAAIADATAEAAGLEDPAEKIMRYSAVIDRWQSKGSADFWRDVRDTPRVRDILSEARATGYRKVVEYLDEGVASGRFRETNTEFVGHVLWQGAISTRDPDLLKRLGVDRTTAVSELLGLILYGMRPIDR